MLYLSCGPSRAESACVHVGGYCYYMYDHSFCVDSTRTARYTFFVTDFRFLLRDNTYFTDWPRALHSLQLLFSNIFASEDLGTTTWRDCSAGSRGILHYESCSCWILYHSESVVVFSIFVFDRVYVLSGKIRSKAAPGALQDVPVGFESLRDPPGPANPYRPLHHWEWLMIRISVPSSWIFASSSWSLACTVYILSHPW